MDRDSSSSGRLTALDHVALATLLPLWLACVGLSVSTLRGPDMLSPLYVDPAGSPTGHPVVAGFWERSARTDLRMGDRLLFFGERDLTGVGRLGAFVFFVGAARASDGVVLVEYERDGVRASTAVAPQSHGVFSVWLPVSALFVIAGVLLLLRTRGSTLGRAFFLAFLATGFQFGISFWASERQTWAMIGGRSLAVGLCLPLTVRAFQLFPDRHRVGGAVQRLWPWVFVLAGWFHAGRFGLMSHRVAVPAALTITLVSLVAIAGLMTRSYRRSDAIGRRRIRWVVLGLYAAVLPPILAGAVTLWDSRFIGLYTASLASVGILPLAVLVSISRFNLFDVDRLLSTAAVWNVFLALGLALALLIVPMLAAAGSEVLGIRTPATQVLVLALFTAAAFATHGQIRSGVERVLFADRFRIDQGAKELHGQIAGCGDARELIACLGRSLDALLKPRSCGVYARDGDAFTPVFGTGRDHALFHASGPLAFTLAHGRKPVALGLSRRFAEPSLAPFDHAVLESLEAAVVVPVFDRGELRMVVCLGEKSSGDVYTPADVHLLSALGDHASTALQRFDQSELLAQMRAMEQELRGFVPRAVAEQLAGGRRLEQGQRELTVLFADIRGYSSLAESQHPEDTFSMLRAYAEMATEAVLRQDGRLVDFAGDGIMAVFGTGTERRAKESAAVHAALEILERAVEVPIQGTPDAGRALSICVGIATGTVFVGEIPSADHRIWAVVGTTTNRASRLQQLSRPLGASIAIDRPTWERTGDVTRAFELRAGVDVRGHREPVDVWLLPAARRTESPSGTPGTSGDAVASV